MNAQQDDNLLDLGWIASLLFWGAFLASACLFGLLVLAPKIEVYRGLSAEFYRRQVRLVKLEEQVDYLARVAEALEHDPEFQAELARVDLNVVEAGTERVAVDISLNMSAVGQPVTPPFQEDPPAPEKQSPASLLSAWLQKHSAQIVHDPVLRRKLYLILAGTVVFAFVFLQDRTLQHSSDQ